jgi:mannose-1-phosphate guanylyltransferase
VPIVKRECAGLGVRVVGEPVARNTAAAIGAAAAWCSAQGGDPAFAVLPADHLILDREAFASDFDRAFAAAEREAVLLLFGVAAERAAPEFGYIRAGAPVGKRLYRVAQFKEKPDRERAAAWVAAGGYFWNTGVFAWRASVLLDALEASRPELARPLRTLAAFPEIDAFERELERVFPSLPSTSIDFAMLEHAPNAMMFEATFDWDDLGSWSAWARHQPHDARGNVLFGDAVALDCDRCIVVGEGGPAAALSLSDMVVVNAGGGTLACRVDDSPEVRRVSEAIRARGSR